MEKQITVKRGLNSVQIATEAETISELLENPMVAALGCPELPEFQVNGLIVDEDCDLRDGDTILISAKASQKA